MASNPPTDFDPYSAYNDTLLNQQAAQIRANGQMAADQSPDAYAGQRNTARQLGLPPAAVSAAPAVPQRQIVAQQIDQNTQRAPVARRAFSDADFARLGHDDSHTTGLMDRFMGWVGGSAPVRWLGDMADAAGHGFVSTVSSEYKGLGGLADAARRNFASVVPNVMNTNALAGAGLATFARFAPGLDDLKPYTQMLDDKAKLLEAKVAQHGLASRAADLIGGLVPFLTSGSAAPVTMGLAGAGDQVQRAQAAGKAPSDAGIVGNAAFQGTLGMLLGGGVFGKLVPQFGGALTEALESRFGSDIASRAVAGLAGQAAQGAANTAARVTGAGLTGVAMQAGSNLIEQQTVNPSRTLGEGVADSAEQMILLDLGMHAISHVAPRIFQRANAAQQGEAQANIADGINLIAEASKVRERAPDVWHSYLQQVTQEHGAPESIYISPQAFAQTFSTPEGQVALTKMPEALQDALQVAQATGGDVKMPTADFGTYVAGTPMYEQLADHVKFDPNSFTRAEAADIMQTEGPRVLAEMDRAVNGKQATDAFVASRDAVEQQIRDQITATNRYSRDVAGLNAKLGAHSVATMAARTGMTPEEFYRQHGFSVGDGESRTASQAFEQSTPPHHDLTGAELGDEPITSDNAVQKARDFFRSSLQNTTAHRAEIGDVRFTNAGWGKTRMGMKADPLRARLLPAVKSIIEHGDYIGRDELPEKRLNGIVAFHHFEGRVRLDGATHEVGVSVGEDEKGNLFYNLTRNPRDRYTRRIEKGSAVTREDARGAEPSGSSELTDPTREVGGGTEELSQSLHETSDDLNLDLMQDAPDGWGAAGDLPAEEVAAMMKPNANSHGRYNPSTSTISLMKTANLSTFIHELGHHHLETLIKLADGHEEIGKDADAILRWFAPDMTREQWNAMGFEERRPFHEQFARGFEAYLFEGKAPTRELRPIFQRMAAWLKNVYRSITGLGVELTPEVRGVMDRLVATPDQIKVAEADLGYRPAFEAKPEFMSDDQWGAYQSLGLQATIDATEALGTRSLRDLQWLEGAKGRELKRLQSEHNALRKAVRDEVSAEVLAEPVYRAREFLKHGRIDGEPVQGVHKLALAEMRAMYQLADEAFFKKLGYGKYGMLAEDGIHPEQVAEAYGYNSVQKLVMDLIEAPRARDRIAELTDQRMLERYGDLNDPAKMAEAALEAVHNDARARLLATEFRALERALGRKSDLIDAAKDMAARVVGDMKVADLKPDRFRAEERRAGERADRAMREGDIEAAAAAKRSQILNFHLAKAVDAAREAMIKQVDYLKGFGKKSRRQRIGTDIELIDQILGDYDLRANPNDNQTVRQVALQRWFETATDSGFEPLVDPRLLVPSPKTRYTDLTTDALTGLHDTVKSIAHVAVEKNTIRTEGKRQSLDSAVGELMAPMIERGDHFTPQELVEPPRVATDGILPVALHRVQSFLMSVFHGSLKGQDFKANRYDMHQIDGPFSRFVFGRLIDRNYWKIDRTHELSQAYMAKAKELGRDWQDALLHTVANDELLDPKTKQPLKITRGRMVRMATHVGNESNFRKMVDGWGWQDDQVWSLLRREMTAKDWDAVQFIWDQFEPLWDESEAMIRRLGGVVPERIEARPFEVDTPDGQRSSLRGGYSPIDYDPLRSKLADRRGANEVDRHQAINPADGTYRATTTRNGALKNRAEGYTDIVSLEFDGIGRNLRDTIHDLAYREALIDADKIMGNETFRDQFLRTYGREEYVALRQMLNNIRDLNARDDGMNEFERIMGWTRTGVVVTGIGYRLSTVAKHGSSAALKSLGYSTGGGQKYFLSRVARLATGNWANDFAEARAKFPEIRARLLQMDRDFKVQEQALLKDETLLQKNERYGHMLVAYSDALSAVATAHAAYDWAVTEGIPTDLGGTGTPMEHDAAVRYASKVVREAHGSALETARSNFLHDRGAKSLLGQLYGFQNNTLGQLLDGIDKVRVGQTSKMAVMARLTASLLMPAVAAHWVANGVAGDDEPWYAWLSEAIAGELASTVPLVRESWKAVEGMMHRGKVDFGTLPVFQVAGNVINIPVDIAHELQGKDTRIIQHAFDALGQIGHIAGAGQVGHMLQYQRDVQSGKVRPDGSADYAKHLLVGGRSKKAN